jgi:hypothetical protein
MPVSAARRAASCFVASTSVVEWSTSTLPGSAPSAMPFGPNTAAARSSLVITLTWTMALARATSAALLAAWTPCSPARATLSATMS